MSHDPVHGKDYLIDYYAILGVDREAAPITIQQAYRNLQKLYHEDRYEGLAPELKAQAGRQSQLLNDAYAILKDASKRHEYNRVLEAWSGPISKSGIPILNPLSEGFSLGGLLEQMTTEEVAKKRQEMALQISGFSELIYNLLRQQIEATDNPSDDLERAYEEQRGRRDLYLSILEEAAWEAIGVKNYQAALPPGGDYGGRVEEAIQGTKLIALEGLTQQVLLLASGQQTMLPSLAGNAEEMDPDATLAQYKQRIEEHIDAASVQIRTIATERQEIAEERLSELKLDYRPNDGNFVRKVILHIRTVDDKESYWMPFEFIENDGGLTALNQEGINLSNMENESVAQRWAGEGYDIITVVIADGVNPFSQIERILELHWENVESAEKQAE